MSNFGENLKQIRVGKKISQGKLAELLSIHATHISRYECNLTIPSIDVVKRLADVLEVSTDDLVYGNLGEKAEVPQWQQEEVLKRMEHSKAKPERLLDWKQVKEELKID